MFFDSDEAKKLQDNQTMMELMCNGKFIPAIKMIESGRVDVNFVDEDGSRPVILAAQHNRLAVIQQLVEEYGAEIHVENSHKMSPILWAQHHNNQDVINFINSCDQKTAQNK